jgi:hypothetical protein
MPMKNYILKFYVDEEASNNDKAYMEKIFGYLIEYLSSLFGEKFITGEFTEEEYHEQE